MNRWHREEGRSYGGVLLLQWLVDGGCVELARRCKSAGGGARRRCCDDVRKWCSSRCCTLSVVIRGTLCARRWRCGGSRARGEDELAVVSGLAMRMRCGEGDCMEEDELAQVALARKWWLQVCAARRDGRKRWRSKLGMECDTVVLRRRCGVVQIPARTGALEMEVEDGCCRGCWCVAGEVRRCSGDCHGGGRRKEN